MFTVTYGVRGARRTSTRNFPTVGEAETFARRWSESNSTGHYWSEVTSVSRGGSTPSTEITHARFNLKNPA